MANVFRIQQSKQFAKCDVVDLANAIGIPVNDRMSVNDIRSLIEARMPLVKEQLGRK